MITTGIKEIKNNLSRYLTQVKTGEEILITDRGKPIARIVKENWGRRTLQETLSPLIRKGLITLPTSSLARENLSPLQVTGKPVSEMVIEDRR